MCRKNPGGSPIKSPKSFWLFIANISTKVQNLSAGGGVDALRGGRDHGPSQCCQARFWAGDERSDKVDGGHSNQMPSPQAAISINHAHNVNSSIECVTLIEKAWGGGIPPFSLCVPHISLKVLTWPWVSKRPPPPNACQPYGLMLY
jgi:hypothetical protein